VIRPEEFKQIFLSTRWWAWTQLAVLHTTMARTLRSARSPICFFPGYRISRALPWVPLRAQGTVHGALCFAAAEASPLTRGITGTDFLSHLGSSLPPVCLENAVIERRLRAGITDF